MFEIFYLVPIASVSAGCIVKNIYAVAKWNSIKLLQFFSDRQT